MFKKLFSGRDKTPRHFIEKTLSELLEKGGFALSADFKKETKDGVLHFELLGEDEGLLKTRDGRLLLAVQSYLNRVARHNFTDVSVRLDSGQFFEDKEKQLLDLVDRLREKALSSGKVVYVQKELPPFQRKQVHQFLEEKGDVTSSSEGEGFYKNIRITPK